MRRISKITKGMLAVMTSFMLTACTGEPQTTNITQGMQQIQEYDYEGALESFEAALVYGEDSQLIYRGIGLAYMGQGLYEEAAENFLTSISFAEGNVTNLEYDTNYYLASAYYKQGKYQEAEKIYSAIIGLRSKETDAYFLRACTRLKEGAYEQAIADFQQAFRLQPDNLDLVTDAFVEMSAAGYENEGQTFLQTFMEEKNKNLADAQKGILYYYMGDYANARTYLDGTLNKGDAKVSLILGKTYEELGDMNYATVVYQTYLDNAAPDAAINNSLGECLMAQGKYEEALAIFTAGIDMGDTAYLQSLKFNQIVAYEYLSDFTTAKNLMQEYIANYPDDSKAKREYEFLQTR